MNHANKTNTVMRLFLNSHVLDYLIVVCPFNKSVGAIIAMHDFKIL